MGPDPDGVRVGAATGRSDRGDGDQGTHPNPHWYGLSRLVVTCPRLEPGPHQRSYPGGTRRAELVPVQPAGFWPHTWMTVKVRPTVSGASAVCSHSASASPSS